MSLRREMLKAASRAPRLLGTSTELVLDFFKTQQNADGGFKDRTGRSDLYYTAFGLDGLIALASQPEESPDFRNRMERATAYLRTFSDGDGLDFVHLCCLARAWGAVRAVYSERLEAEPVCPTGILRRIEAFRSSDGGYSPKAGNGSGTVYGAFLALGAHQDLMTALPAQERLIESVLQLSTPDGAWSNQSHSTTGATNPAAAAVSVLRSLGTSPPSQTACWLLTQAHPLGGFRATPETPIPDLLSTATTLHALAGLGASIDAIREPCLNFLDSLWVNQGAFHGHWEEDQLDVEYTYYALLALGHLAL